MTVTALEIRHDKRDNQLNFGLDRATRDALATYFKLRWPSNTAKHGAREFDLTLDEARGIVACRTSIATLDRIWKHPNGGWAVLIPVMGAVIGETAEQFITEQRRRQLENARRISGLSRDYRAVCSVSSDRNTGVADQPPRRRSDDRS
jgi:hypothetical protein